MDTEAVWQFLSTRGADLGLKLLAAIATWIIGRWLIAVVLRLFCTALERSRRMDATLVSYLRSVLGVVLNIVLILAILDIFGVKTTSFAALLAGAGLAIGTAWGGLLTHFAAGVFMQVLRPFKVGDYIQAGGITGRVQEIGLFGTTLISADHVHTLVGNNAIFSGAIHNYSRLPHRRVDTQVRLAAGVQPGTAIALLRPAIAAVPNVLDKPPPEIEILDFAPDGATLCVRPYCRPEFHSQVYFDTHKAVSTALAGAGAPVDRAAPPG
jgi:small conductance mechanosensitive channel